MCIYTYTHTHRRCVCESEIMYGIEVWGLGEARKEVNKVHSVQPMDLLRWNLPERVGEASA